jgi:hypothetical protein
MECQLRQSPGPPALQWLTSSCLKVIEDPHPSELARYVGLSNQEDLPILVAEFEKNAVS